MVTSCMICHNTNDDSYHMGREGGGQRVMIEIIISENDDNDGKKKNFKKNKHPLQTFLFYDHIQHDS